MHSNTNSRGNGKLQGRRFVSGVCTIHKRKSMINQREWGKVITKTVFLGCENWLLRCSSIIVRFGRITVHSFAAATVQWEFIVEQSTQWPNVSTDANDTAIDFESGTIGIANRLLAYSEAGR